MSKFFSTFVGLICLSNSLVAQITPTTATKEEMVNHIIGIQNTFQSVYAPAAWKKKFYGWDIETATQMAIEEVSQHSNITLKDYQQILVKLFNSPQDYHVSIHFHSTEGARLPFRMRLAEGRYFVVWVSDKVSKDFPIKLGDEVLAFGEKPIDQAIDELIVMNRRDLINDTDKNLAAISLTARSGATGYRIPQGDVEVVVKHLASGEIKAHKLTWEYRKELIKGLADNSPTEKKIKKQRPSNIYEAISRFDLHTKMFSPTAKGMMKFNAQFGESSIPIGDRRGPLPFLGQPLWTSGENSFFFSYLFKTPEGKTMGYIRIPHFHGEEDDQGEQVDVNEFRRLIQTYQRKTDGLVIDMVDNVGGYLHLTLAYLGMLTDKPLPFFKVKVALTQADVEESLEAIEEIDYIVKHEKLSVPERNFYNQLREYFTFIISQWELGHYLSDPVYLYGFKNIEPDASAHYKKPILVLINGMDFSCGDIFPANLQDNKRATLFGSKTAGAGGSIRQHDYPNRLGIASYSYTATILERKDKQPIENLGVTPDIKCELTTDDLQYDYRDYRQEVLKAIRQLLK